MFAVCIRYIGDRYAAQDVLHDGFITLFAKLGTYKGDGSFDGWARRIFVNTALMQIRKADVLKNSEDIEAPYIDVEYGENVIDKIDTERLFAIISQMPAGFRAVFNLYIVEGFSHEEIAKALNISEGGSRSQLSRAREWLKARIHDF
jgi:RNA polymerase sigma factor (sigma-70 family)